MGTLLLRKAALLFLLKTPFCSRLAFEEKNLLPLEQALSFKSGLLFEGAMSPSEENRKKMFPFVK